MKFKEEYDKLSDIVNQNKENLSSLSIKLNKANQIIKENEENFKKKIDTLKKHSDDKYLELNTKLELFLNNLGKEDGENLAKKFDLSGLNDFMQKLINLENKFEDFTSNSNINDLGEHLKTLEDKKAEKTDLEQFQKLLDELNNKLKEEVDSNNQKIESMNQQIADVIKNNEGLKNKEEVNEIKEGKKDLEYPQKIEKNTKLEVDSHKNSLDIESLDLYLSKYVLKSNYEDFLKINKEKINKMSDEINKINNQINNIKKDMSKKVSIEELNEFRDFLSNKLEELVNEFEKNYSSKQETSKYLKYLDEQVKNLLILSKTKPESHESDNWLLATKPIRGFSCAACESYIGDLRNEKKKFVAWNKLPTRESGEKLYRMGNGFSKMLAMLNFDSNGNPYLNPNSETSNSDDENKNDSKRNKDLSTLLIKNKSQKDGLSVLNENKANINKIGKRTQNNFFKKEEIKTAYLPNIKKDILPETLGDKKENEENPKVTKILKKARSKLHFKESY